MDYLHPDDGHPIQRLARGMQGRRRSIGVSLARAFHEEPNFTYMLPRRHSRLRAMRWFFGSLVVGVGLRRGVVEMAEDGSAAAIWLEPGAVVGARDALAAGALRLPLEMGITGARRSLAVSRAVEGERSRQMTTPHWYLMAIGVHPERQGRGIGRALLARGLARADRTGRPVYLETFRERTAQLYGRRGFQEVDRTRVGRGGPTFIAMLRPPHPTEGTGLPLNP